MEELDHPEGSVSDRGGERQTASLPLPAAFLEFLNENGLDPAVYSMAATIPRYIRYPCLLHCTFALVEVEGLFVAHCLALCSACLLLL
jgi:hypothetical protein